MAIWFDMTNSMKTSQGANDAGVIRAELEIARSLHALNDEIRFFFSDEIGFKELKKQDLEWLWNAEKVSDAYMNRKKVHLNKIVLKTAHWNMPEGLENAYSYSIARIDRIRRARELWLSSLQGEKKRFVGKTLTFLPFRALKIMSAVNAKRKQKKLLQISDGSRIVNKFSYPFSEKDTIFSCGFFGSNKEEQFSELKAKMRSIKIGYLIYDLFYVKKETASIYPQYCFENFSNYLEWISNNCDFVVYGGKTAQRDAEEYFKEHNFRVPEGFPIKFGSEITHSTKTENNDRILNQLGIEKKYILAVGSVVGKKNYNTIYKAYTIMGKKYDKSDIPMLVIVGGKHPGTEELIDVISTDKLTSEKIKFVHATDEELDVLYRNTKFTILPSLYEGWSLTLPESLAYGKLCIASDVAPLREIGESLIEYVNPLDPVAWAEKIMYFIKHEEQIKTYNDNIVEKWKPITWMDCGKMLLDNLKSIDFRSGSNEKMLYYDLSATYYSSIAGASVSGILRTQLLLARYLSRINSDMKFCAFTPEECIVIDKERIAPLLSNVNIEAAFKQCVGKLHNSNEIGVKKQKNIDSRNLKKQAFWMMLSVFPEKVQQMVVNKKRKITEAVDRAEMDYKVPFNNGDLVFSSGAGMLSTIYDGVLEQKKQVKFKFVQLIYDYTPVLLPQVHRRETREFYTPFLKYTTLLSDTIFYGGETAKRDGIEYAKENNLPVREGVTIKFGSNIVQEPEENEEQLKKDTFEKYGIHGSYIMAVGSIEIRKNHETLYQAYIEMMKRSEEVPQLLFCGYPGWKTKEFCDMLLRDERVKGKIILMQPTDKELRVLYKNCLFTVLASLYEGWSLTLPESLNYGKFCICTDCDPLRETGCDFIDYVEAYDWKQWADKILFYYKNAEELKQRERYIINNWHAISWQECAEQVSKELKRVLN